MAVLFALKCSTYYMLPLLARLSYYALIWSGGRKSKLLPLRTMEKQPRLVTLKEVNPSRCYESCKGVISIHIGFFCHEQVDEMRMR